MSKRKLTRQEIARMGGRALVEKYGKEHMSEIGRKGQQTFREKYTIKPCGIGDYMIIEKATGKIMPRTLCGLSIDEYMKEHNKRIGEHQ